MVYGEHTLDKEGNIVCKCGKADHFLLKVHIDMEDKAISEYRCANCGNIIQVHTKREMLW